MYLLPVFFEWTYFIYVFIYFLYLDNIWIATVKTTLVTMTVKVCIFKVKMWVKLAKVPVVRRNPPVYDSSTVGRMEGFNYKQQLLALLVVYV